MKHLNLEKLKTEIDAAMQADLDDNRIGGASVIVCQEDIQPGKGTGIRFGGYYGKTNTETGEDMKPNTVFRLASMTKPVTAAAVLLQVQNGLIGLHDKVSDYLPCFRDMIVGAEDNGKVVPGHKVTSEIEVYHLLTHTSGILAADFVGLNQPIPRSERVDLAHIVEYYGTHILLSNDPLGKALYSACAAFDVAARLVEITSGMTFAEFVKKNFFDPLEMHDTAFQPGASQWARMTAMHNRVDGKNVIVPMDGITFADFPLTYTCGGASLTASIEDYAKFAEMLLHEGGGILSPETVRLMRTPWIPETVPGIGRTETWGLGVRVITGDPVLPRGAFGWSGAYGTHFWVDPDNHLYAVYAKNSCYDGGSGARTARVFEQCVMKALE